MRKLKEIEIKIFCEKSKPKGNGHFIRSKRLYNFLKLKKFRIFFGENFSSREINKKIATSQRKFFLILDYKDYKKINIKKNSNILKTIVFENLKKKKFYKNLNIYPLDIQYKLNSGPKFYQYPKEFYKVNRTFNLKKKYEKKKLSILILQGGTDANNNINTLVKKLSKKKFFFDTEFIVKTNNLNNIKKIKLLDNVSIIGKVKNILTVLKNVDFAISACGGFAFELGYLGVPTIHVTSEKREVTRAKLLQKKNLGKFFHPQSINKIFNEINKIYYKKTYRNMLINNRLNFFRKKNKILNLLVQK